MISKGDSSQEAADDIEDKPSSKRRKGNAGPSAEKSEETVGSKHDNPDLAAKQASKSRLPKKGRTVSLQITARMD